SRTAAPLRGPAIRAGGAAGPDTDPAPRPPGPLYSRTAAPLRSPEPLIAAEDADDHALDAQRPRVHVGGPQGAVGGLQAYPTVTLAEQLLERDALALEQGDHHLAVAGGLAVLDDDVVAVADLL